MWRIAKHFLPAPNGRSTLFLHLVGERKLISRHSPDTPVLLGRFMNRDLNVLRRDAQFLIEPTENAPNQLLFRLLGSTGKHTDLNDRVAGAAVLGMDEILLFHGDEPVKSFVRRQTKGFGDAHVQCVRNPGLSAREILAE